jgi:hypothetical protein
LPNYVSNVINNTPASSHNIYLTDILNNIDVQKLFIPGSQLILSYGGHRINKASNKSRAYIWDLYRLGYTASNNRKEYGHFTRVPIFSDPFFNDPQNLLGSNKNYFPLYCSSYNDNAGNNIYKPLANFTGLTLNNVPIFSEQKYSANFSFNPLYSTSFNVQYDAEYLIYKASVIPLYPMMTASSIPTHKTFGPCFMSSFRISVDGSSSVGDVEIQASFSGGKSMISPSNIPPYKPFTTTARTNMLDLDGNVLPEYNLTLNSAGVSSLPFQSYYRPINLTDCFFDASTFHKSYASFINFVRNSKNVNFRLVSMTLEVSQNILFEFTMPGGDLLNDGSSPVYFGDKVGPRFASLSSREVTGSIKIFSYVNTSIVNKNTTSLTMSFGPLYFYRIKNVDWSNPDVQISPTGGYTHEYKFVAKLGEFTAYFGTGNPLVSEFHIS